MKTKRPVILLFLSFFIFGMAFLSPAAAKVMTAEDVSGEFYGARITDNDGTFATTLYEVSADGSGNIDFEAIEGNQGPLASNYDVSETGMLTTEWITGGISPDGNYLAIGKFKESGDMLFGIRKSSDLTDAAISGSYQIYIFYETFDDEDNNVIYSNSGSFQVDKSGELTGAFAEGENGQLFTGDYTIGYEVGSEGEPGNLKLTGLAGSNHEDLGPNYGVVSQNGNAFVAIDTVWEGSRSHSYIVGIQQSEMTMSDLPGDYHVTDFGFYDLAGDGTADDGETFVMDFTAAEDGDLSFEETRATCDDCTINTEVTGTYSLVDSRRFDTVFDNYPEDIKPGGPLYLDPAGDVFTLTQSKYLAIGISKASGTPDEVTELAADAGPDQVVSENTLVTLDGSGSVDPEDAIDSYEWEQTEIGDGPEVDLVNRQSVQAEFTAPDVDAETDFTFELTVEDVDGNTATDSVTVTVNNVSPGNQPPVADAGKDQQVDEGDEVNLDGSASTDPDGEIDTYTWQQTGDGPSVDLVDAERAQTEFTAPDVDAETQLTFELTVSDIEGETDTDSVRITINNVTARNQSPTADAGASQTVCVDESVVLDGSNSSDADGEIVGYTWSQTAGPSVSLDDEDATDGRASFTAPEVAEETTLTFELEVTDDGGLTDTQSVDVTVNPDENENGMPDVMESTDSDIDGDGTPDFEDDDSVRFQLGDSGQYMGIYCENGALAQIDHLQAADADLPEQGKPEGDMPYGLFSYHITGLDEGETVEVTFVLPEALPENLAFYKVDEAEGWQQLDYQRGEDDNTVTISLTDGDPATDQDGRTDGIIVDPSTIVTGAGFSVGTGDGNGGGGGDDDWCFIQTIWN